MPWLTAAYGKRGCTGPGRDEEHGGPACLQASAGIRHEGVQDQPQAGQLVRDIDPRPFDALKTPEEIVAEGDKFWRTAQEQVG
jgi:hypothetical protein